MNKDLLERFEIKLESYCYQDIIPYVEDDVVLLGEGIYIGSSIGLMITDRTTGKTYKKDIPKNESYCEPYIDILKELKEEIDKGDK